MRKKIIIVFLSLIVLCFVFVGCSENESSKNTESDMTEIILSQFQEITEISRPSHHEEKISAYLKEWAEDRGFSVVQDDYYNIIFDVPATKGYEALPTVALQCHMDMVFAQKEGLDLDPLTTPITTVRDDNYLSSDGKTSLGADDGIGISVVLCIAEGKMDHGPLRIIFTTSEEDSMVGTMNLDPKYVSDIEYLINVDAETEGEVCVTTAAGDTAHFTKEFADEQSSKNTAYQIDIKGLTGGHSGIDIHENRLNGGMEMGFILNTIQDEGVAFELKSLNAGTAENMIINSASSVVYVDKSDADKLIAIVKSCEKVLKDKGASTDPDMEITVSEVHLDDDLILSESDKNVVLAFLKELKNGVRTMSPDIEDLVESSANLGILNVTPTSFEAGVMSRSCSAEKQEQQLNEQKELANALNCKIEIAHAADAWEYNPDGNLEKIMRKSYKKLFGKDMKVIAVHAGLECGTFAKYNNELDMVAIGPTITDPHSINEKIEISSIEKVWSLLKETLINID